MILRRIIGNIRTRDWFTVTIEFLIVVFGIFVGLEVSNWNEDRKFAAQERSFLVQLRDEIAHNHRATEYQARFTRDVVEAGRRVLVYLESDGDCGEDCAPLLVDVFHASQVWGTAYRESKFDEVERLGFPSAAALRDTVQAYYLHLDGWDVVNSFTPAYRERARGHINPEAFVYLWRDCYSLLGGNLEQLTRDCVNDLQRLDTDSILRSLYADAALSADLRFWIGQNISASVFYPAIESYGSAAIDALTADLETN